MKNEITVQFQKTKVAVTTLGRREENIYNKKMSNVFFKYWTSLNFLQKVKQSNKFIKRQEVIFIKFYFKTLLAKPLQQNSDNLNIVMILGKMSTKKLFLGNKFCTKNYHPLPNHPNFRFKQKQMLVMNLNLAM